MNKLTEQELSAALHRIVAEPADLPRRVTQVRQRASRMRRRRVATGSSVLTVALATVAVVTLVSRGPNDPPGPVTQPDLQATSTTVGRCTFTSCVRLPPTIPAALRRPLRLPRLAAGEPCPVSGSRQFAAGGGFSSAFQAFGPGPFYLTGSSEVSFDYPPPSNSTEAGTGWGGAKVIWAVDSTYNGPLLIRGAQIDGRNGLRFDHYLGSVGYSGTGTGDGKAYPELAYPAATGTAALRTYPSVIRLQAPGCYAIQVDGTGFSEQVIFAARLDNKR